MRVPIMSVSKARARKAAKRILRDNKKGRSFRVIAREDYPVKWEDGSPIIKAGTLNRFANEKGNYIPVDKEILIALGLKKKREPRTLTPMQEKIKWMADEVKQALMWKTL